jgi:hypothetical protein
MNDGNYVRCWTVRCKTRNCDSLLFLDVIGPANRALHALQPLCKPFEIACPECGIQHLYVQSDLEERDWENPPRGRCREFLEAIGWTRSRVEKPTPV